MTERFIYCVTSAFFDDGSTTADIEAVRYTGAGLPETAFYCYENADVWQDYYNTLEEAEQAKKEALCA